MSIQLPEQIVRENFLLDDYFVIAYINGRQFIITTKPFKTVFGNRIETPFSDDVERRMFLDFSLEFSALLSQSSLAEKTAQEPSEIQRRIGRLKERLLSSAKRLCRSFWQGCRGRGL